MFDIFCQPNLTILTVVFCVKNSHELQVPLNVLGTAREAIDSVRFPPYYDIDFSDSLPTLNFSQLGFDWEFLDSYGFAKMQGMILEVRPQNTLLTESLWNQILPYHFMLVRME